GAATQSSSNFRSASGNVNVSVQQQTQIRQSVLSSRNVARVSNVNFAVSVGAVVPSRVHVVGIRTFPVLIEAFPQFRDDSFFVADDDIVVIDHLVTAVDDDDVAHGGSSGGSVAALDLSREEIIEVQ